jgi:hypothetical protein
MGCLEPVVGFEPVTRCLSGSGSVRVTCPLPCAGVHTRRCLLVLVPSVVPEWSPSSTGFAHELCNNAKAVTTCGYTLGFRHIV